MRAARRITQALGVQQLVQTTQRKINLESLPHLDAQFASGCLRVLVFGFL